MVLCPDPQLGTREGWGWCGECGALQPPTHVHSSPLNKLYEPAAREAFLFEALELANAEAERAQSMLCAVAFQWGQNWYSDSATNRSQGIVEDFLAAHAADTVIASPAKPAPPMVHNWEYEGHSPHNNQSDYRCTRCGKSDWCATYEVPEGGKCGGK